MNFTNQSLRPDLYYQFIDKEGVLDSWPLVQKPTTVLFILSIYLIFVLKLGPFHMKNKEPFQLKELMIVYNLFQVMYNVWMLYLVSSRDVFMYLVDHSCHPADPANSFHIRYTLHLSSWHYLCSKIIDLLDTCIMVLRKKQSHITFLHLYHHVAMVFFVWFSIKYVKAQQGIPPILLNNVVHVVMYTYYLLACLGPKVQRYLWWKRYLTKLQLTQFALVITYLAYLYCYQCEVSQAFNLIWIVNVSVIAGFFINFYIQTYIIKPRRTRQKNQ